MGSTPNAIRLPFFVDLFAVLVATGVLISATGVGTLDRLGTALLSVFVISYLFIVPGYSLIAGLFARRNESWISISRSGPKGDERIDARTRLILSITLSPILTGLVVLTVDWSPAALRRGTILGALGIFVGCATMIAFLRRWSIPASDRYAPAVPVAEWLRPTRSPARLVALAIALVCVLVAAHSLASTTATWEPGERMTELYLLTSTDGGEPVANAYGPDEPLLVGIENREHRRMNYTVLIRVEEVTIENGTATPRNELQMSQFQVSGLSHSDRHHEEVDLSVAETTEPVRVTVLLYRGTPSENRSSDTAYRSTHLWFQPTG